MATRNIVPRATGEGSIGTSAKTWGAVYADDVAVTNNVTASSFTGDITGSTSISFTTQGEVGFRGTTHTEPADVCKQVIVTSGTVDGAWNDGNAKLALHTYDTTQTNSAEDGSFTLAASDSTNIKTLVGKPDGSLTWDGAVLVPTGVVQAFAGSTSPAGWLLCDGSAVSRTDYAALFAVIGTTYGSGNGSTTFNLPNLTDKFIQGNSTSGTVKAAGLPNITGQTSPLRYGTTTVGQGASQNNGAFTTSSPSAGSTGQVSTGSGVPYQSFISLDASKSNSIYGNSTTVQPPALTMRYIIKY